MKILTIILGALFAFSSYAQNLGLTVNTNGVLTSTNFFRRNQATLGLESVLRTNGTWVGTLTGDQVQASLVSSAVRLPNIANGFNDPPDYAAPISMVTELTPRVADTLVDLLAVPMLAKAERGVSVWAYVLGGPNPGTYCFCPLLTTAQNSTTVWRPDDILTDAVAGRWVLMSTGGGATGAQGPAGPAGPPGTTWYSGSGAPSGGLGIVNDRYLNNSNGDHYQKTGTTTWTLLGSLKGTDGATGATGATGPAGAAGSPGSVWRSGSGAPSGSLGIVGDWFLNTVNGDVYEKTGASTYTLRDNLTGPSGGGGGGSISTNPNNALIAGTDSGLFAPFANSDAYAAIQAMGSQFKGGTIGKSPMDVTTTHNLTDARAGFIAVWLPTRSTITGIAYGQSNPGSFTADAFNGIALYTLSGTTLTQIAVSANTSDAFNNSTGIWRKLPFTSQQTLNAGLYFVGYLYNSAAQTTAPVLRAAATPASQGVMQLDTTSRIHAFVEGQASLPSTFDLSTANTSQSLPMFFLY